MRSSNLSLLALFSAALITTALPTELTNFLLVTTNQSTPTSNSSSLRAVSATSLFDPFYQATLYLRLTGPGYGSLPNFTLSSGTLHTTASGPHGIGIFEYNSTIVVNGTQLGFVAAEQPAGNLALDGGYLLTVGGQKEGWAICPGDLEQEVLFWNKTEAGCEKTYLHAVKGAPY
ncbi:hypothetical protein BCR34DRAFT_599301 [Clohesyomyces aquaticus]|uniref:Pullulan synthetase n=1 Tax=Clohesyomyces aquaticus TaxID=1231657 RepID=A0A1Y1ZVV5_9PLEO|nr:hypothetical protein BCR34DRAFT_599301 [Clohesyomyces aquaticus]